MTKLRKKIEKIFNAQYATGEIPLKYGELGREGKIKWRIDQLLKLTKDYCNGVIGEINRMIGSGKYSHDVELTDKMVSNAFLNLKGKNARIVKFDEFELVDDLAKLRAEGAK